jgi:hypothetical protein
MRPICRFSGSEKAAGLSRRATLDLRPALSPTSPTSRQLVFFLNTGLGLGPGYAAKREAELIC